jgi:hypothetical protein
MMATRLFVLPTVRVAPSPAIRESTDVVMRFSEIAFGGSLHAASEVVIVRLDLGFHPGNPDGLSQEVIYV